MYLCYYAGVHSQFNFTAQYILYHMKVLLHSFHMDGHALEFHQQTLKFKSNLVWNNKQNHMKVLLNCFHLNGHTLGFPAQLRIVRNTLHIFYGTRGNCGTSHVNNISQHSKLTLAVTLSRSHLRIVQTVSILFHINSH